MRKIFLLGLGMLLSTLAMSQVTVKGRTIDGISGELLEGVTITTRNQSALSGKDGNFTMVLPMGEYSLVAVLVGYDNDTVYLQADRNLITDVVFRLDNQSAAMQAVQVTASVAKNRKTPVAYSNFTGKDISERLGSSDLPLLLNQTPGVYATSQGGGAGDARITIRGFSQRNIAVMVDGIPVNDMENGQVYWSNWFGLGNVTALTQVQRGLGSSRIANPAVGGTMNIITKGISQQARLEANVEMGDSKYEQFSMNYSSGRLKGGWGVLLSVTKRQSAGYVDYLYDDMYSYFGKVEKQWKTKSHGLHTLSLWSPNTHKTQGV
jgi:outer membrane receptor for Fe3+-dicitrate